MGLFNPCNPAVNAVIIYIILILILIIVKPKFMYDYNNNKYKEFGCNENQTYFPLILFGALSSIIIYYIFVYIGSINCIDKSKVKYLVKYA